MFELNLWGHEGSVTEEVNTAIADDVLASLENRDPKPGIVAFSEVCDIGQGEDDDLYDGLNELGYTVTFYGPYNFSNACGDFGNVVATQFPVSDTEPIRRFLYQNSPDHARTNVCLNTQGFVPGLVCSTHLANSDSLGRSDQIVELAQQVQGNPIIVAAGDLNFRHDEPELNFLYNSGFAEGTGRPPSATPTFKSKDTGAELRLDYIFIFLIDYFFDPHLPGRIRGPLNNTDHYIYEAFLQ